jgi:uncharacterized protein (DUF58 family)
MVLAGALVGILAWSGWDLVLLRREPPLEMRRHLPERAFTGRSAEVQIILAAPGEESVRVDLIDEAPVDVVAGEPHFSDVAVTPGRDSECRYSISPSRRGDRPFGAIVALARSPLGCWRRRVIAESGQVLRVYPDTTRFLRPEALDPRRVFEAMGVRPVRRRGEGMEFESLRDYVPGDDPRRIDWAASARRGRLVSRLYQHERRQTVIVALDTSRLMAVRVGRGTKLDYAVEAVLALMYGTLVSGDRVGLVVFDREVRGAVSPGTHRAMLAPFIEVLRVLEPRLVEANYAALARTIAARQPQRALIVVLTDFVEADAAALTEPLTVLARRHRVLLVAVRDPLYSELEPPSGEASDDRLGLYRRLVLNDLLVAREAALAALRRQGLQTLDLPPAALTAAVLNCYLALRHGPG